ncbi:peptidase domain-containing ABC transporter [Dictyobacter arantiisoli]|uniref:NHLP family bacteriocin export ABC transporter peptidase/permease/ATPase n=1 Tax=Dictyobacter arantiisoli TaxID=2014874 RepID=A0A5A5T7K8_9CHLR|nr:peptidase domain-containing ABC transporter [Dictyobacter arantiisoli]GCF06904.1 NHLP family bacteriocin export ABC transporter peptidase/permease/ATPase [Dictyobacter arantiisoli]
MNKKPDELEASILRFGRRRSAYLSDLEFVDQPTAPEVQALIDHREQTMLTQAFSLQMAQAQEKIRETPPPHMSSQSPSPPTRARTQKHKHRRQAPSLLQMEAVECGAACLAMILSYYRRKTSVAEMREFCGVGRDGLNALELVKAARAFHLVARSISLAENDLSRVTLPAIVHWEFNHFLIVEKWTPQIVQLLDPAIGRRRVTAEEFDRSFTGIVIMLEPDVDFSTANPAAERLNLRAYVRQYLHLAPGALGQILLASLLLQLFGLVTPIFTEVVVDQIIPFKLHDALTLLSIGLLLLIISETVTTLLRATVLTYLQSRLDMEMMLSFFDHLLKLPLRFFQQRSSGDIISRLSSNLVIRDAIGNQLISTILDGAFVLVYFIILLCVSPIMTLLVVILGVLQAILLFSTARSMRDLSRRELIASGKAQGYFSEVLKGIVSLKAAGAEQRARATWSNFFYEQMNVSNRRFYLSSLISTGMGSLSALAPFLLLWLGTIQVLNGSLPVGSMLALNALAISLLLPLSSLISSGQTLQYVQAHLERIADVMDAVPEQDVTTVKQPPRLRGSIRLENVSFRYDVHSPPILSSIYVNIAAAQKVALVGKSGSGKTTLGKLLLGLYLPTQGEIYYDNIPLSALNYQAVRAQFGVVMQEATVFSGSVRQNIAFNDPTIGMERVIKVAQIAALHDDIMQMPMEYETFVSEGGSALSGGQRQRIALARAIATAPTALLLDEATSSLDVVTEAAVERNLRKFACTQIIIAHRLSTIRNANQIFVLDQGKIVERGTHRELVNMGGFYAKLIQSQLENGEIKAD